jgi:predicted MFS family arabinose efflux permease
MAKADATGTARRPGGLLRQRNFRLLWVGETVSGIGSAMAAVGVPLLAVAVLKASTFAVSALTAAAYAPWLVIGLPAGAWADRLPARTLMIVCDIVSAAAYASLPIAAWAGVLTVGQVLGAALLAGAANVFFATAYQVYLPALVTADELMEGNAKLQGSASVASVSGRALAGLAAELVGDATSLLFNAGSFIVSAACLLAIGPPAAPPQRATHSTTIGADISEGLNFIWRDPLLRWLTVYPAIANLAYSGSTAIVVVFLVRQAGFNAAGVGLLMAAGGIGGILGAVIARRLAVRLGTARAMLLAALGTGPFALLIPLTATGPRAAFYIAGAAVVSAGITGGNVIMVTFRQAYCPPHMLGRISASQRFVVYGGIPLGALLAGALGTALTVRTALWVLLSLFALSGTLLLRGAILADRDLPSRSPELAADRG